MKKISRTSWLVLAAGVFVIAAASLGAARSQQLNEQDKLNDELSMAKQRLSLFQIEKLSLQQDDLEDDLFITMSRVETIKAKFSESIDSITTSDTLFVIADTCGVEITEIKSSISVSSDLEGIDISFLPFAITAKGALHNLINFIVELHDNFDAGIVDSVEMHVSETSDDEESSADIQLLIYTYEGD